MAEVTIIDGGMCGELIRRGAAENGGLWSAKPLLDNPRAVVETHLAFIDAGARFIITNSYSTVPSYLEKKGLAQEYERLTALAGELAREAADESPHAVTVAGSLPPLSESYRADLAPQDDTAREIYARMAAALEPNVDLFLCETMSSVRESINAASGARTGATERDLPIYVSWTLNEVPGAGLRSGESIEEAVAATASLGIDGYLCNCTAPEAIEAAIERLAGLTDKPIGGYPNRFVEVPEGWTLDNDKSVGRRTELTPEAFAQAASRCVAKGATLFGGCCGVGPEYIEAVAKAVGPPA